MHSRNGRDNHAPSSPEGEVSDQDAFDWSAASCPYPTRRNRQIPAGPRRGCHRYGTSTGRPAGPLSRPGAPVRPNYSGPTDGALRAAGDVTAVCAALMRGRSIAISRPARNIRGSLDAGKLAKAGPALVETTEAGLPDDRCYTPQASEGNKKAAREACSFSDELDREASQTDKLFRRRLTR